MDLAGFEVRPCKNGLAFDVVPRKPLELNLAAVCARLREKGLEVEAETPAVALLKVKGKPLSLYKNGKIQVRQTREKAEAEALAREIVGLL